MLEAQNHPENMSEIFALLFVSMGWDQENNSQEIHKAILNWRPEGKIDNNWQRNKEHDFDMDVDYDTVIEKMRYFAEIWERLQKEARRRGEEAILRNIRARSRSE
jgi:hypothetical protein